MVCENLWQKLVVVHLSNLTLFGLWRHLCSSLQRCNISFHFCGTVNLVANVCCFVRVRPNSLAMLQEQMRLRHWCGSVCFSLVGHVMRHKVQKQNKIITGGSFWLQTAAYMRLVEVQWTLQPCNCCVKAVNVRLCINLWQQKTSNKTIKIVFF